MGYGFRRAGIGKNGNQEARGAEEQGFGTIPERMQGRPLRQVTHGVFIGVVAQRLRQVFV